MCGRPAGMARIGSSGPARLGRLGSRLPLRASVAGGDILWRPSAPHSLLLLLLYCIRVNTVYVISYSIGGARLLLSMSAAAVAAAAAATRPNLRVMQQVSLSNAGRVNFVL